MMTIKIAYRLVLFNDPRTTAPQVVLQCIYVTREANHTDYDERHSSAIRWDNSRYGVPRTTG